MRSRAGPLGGRLDIPTVLRGFAVLDAIALAGAAALWAHLGHHLKWTRSSQWVGFVALFGCFANARHVWTRRRAIAFAVLALPWSKLWLRIGYDRPGVFWQSRTSATS